MRPSCCVCYEPSISKCFFNCESFLCMDCLIKLIEINKASIIYYTCPCCRQEIIKNINVEFTDFCNLLSTAWTCVIYYTCFVNFNQFYQAIHT